MKAMTSYIEIGDYVFRKNAGVKVESDWRTLGDTATIYLPNLGDIESKVRVGQPVLIRLGFDGDLRDEFRGYVSSTRAGVPFEVQCEDEIWQLKQRTITKTWPSILMGDLIKELVPGADVSGVLPVRLTNFRADRVNVAKILSELKKSYMLTAYFRAGNLIAGLPYGESVGKEYWHFQKNALIGDLEYRRKDDIRIKLRAINLLPDNKKMEWVTGDEDGDERTLHFYNLSEAELKRQAEEKMELLKYDGYTGSFRAFGDPYATHGMVANIEDGKYPERKGEYFIDAVTTTYDGDRGYMREITLGRKAAS